MSSPTRMTQREMTSTSEVFLKTQSHMSIISNGTWPLGLFDGPWVLIVAVFIWLWPIK